jgi:hypothetical protein
VRVDVVRILRDRALERGDGRVDVLGFGASSLRPFGALRVVPIAVGDLRGKR